MSSTPSLQSDTVDALARADSQARLTGQEFYRQWLTSQAGKIPDSFFGLLVLHDETANTYQAVAAWPEQNSSMDAVEGLIEGVLKENKGLITALEDQDTEAKTDQDGAYLLAYPVIVEQTVIAVVTLAVLAKDKDALKYAMQQLQWGCGWLESTFWHQQAMSHDREHMSRSVDLMARVLSEETFNAATARFVSELAMMFECDRVSIGLMDKKAIKIKQISHSAQFGKKMNLIRCIESAMEESVDQKKPIQLPATDSDTPDILLAHHELMELQHSVSVMTVPLYLNYEIAGAITLERDAGEAFSDQDIELCESVSALAFGILNEKRENDKHILSKIHGAINQQVSHLIGKEHYLYKLVSASVLVLLLLLFFYPADYRVSADAILESDIKRSIIAPFDGYIDKALVRAGDEVAEGELLVSLDDKDLRLQRLKWISQKEKLNRQYQESLSKHERARVKIINSQIAQAQAELELVEMQLERAGINAPFDGLILSGDLSNRLGGAVERGELMFEITPRAMYRVKLKVKQSQIADIEVGQQGMLYLSALPHGSSDITITKITPVTISQSGNTYYEVEAELKKPDEQFQYGMEGIGKIMVGSRPLISVLTRELSDWFRIKWWSIFG